jgi:lysophospholipase L1-like esterase
MKHAKTWIFLLGALSVALFLTLLFIIYRDGYFDALYKTVNAVPYSYADNAQYTQRETLFEASPSTHADIIFIGDSITARGEWQEFFPDKIVLNRGIDSDVTEGVYNRLDTIIDKQPDKIFLMIGINDIRQGIDKNVTLDFYAKILDKLTDNLSDCTIYVQSILPVNSSTGIDNCNVQALNTAIKALADERSLTYIDLYSLLADTNNDLPKDYSIDGVHMTGDGYSIWIEALKKYM